MTPVTYQAVGREDFRALQHEVAELRADMRELIDAWTAAKGIVRLVKFIGALAAAYAGVWSIIKLGSK